MVRSVHVAVAAAVVVGVAFAGGAVTGVLEHPPSPKPPAIAGSAPLTVVPPAALHAFESAVGADLTAAAQAAAEPPESRGTTSFVVDEWSVVRLAGVTASATLIGHLVSGGVSQQPRWWVVTAAFVGGGWKLQERLPA